MKLKGWYTKFLSKEQKIKMKKTLKRMEKVRKEDNMWLRNIIEQKIKIYNEEKEKGLKLINALKTKIEDLEKQVLKLEGAITALQEILKEKK